MRRPRTLSPLAWLRAERAARLREREFEPLVDEVVTAADAERVGLPAEWFENFARTELRREVVRVEHLLPALDDPSIRDLLRFVGEQRRLREDLRDVLDRSVSPYDVIAAGFGDARLLAVAREVFPGRSEATIAEWIPHVRRPAVARFLLGGDGRPSPSRVRRVLEHAAAREALRREIGSRLESAVDVEMAIQSGVGNDDLRRLVREWFGPKTSRLTLDQLLLVRHVDGFARLLGWHAMMLGATPEERARLAAAPTSR